MKSSEEKLLSRGLFNESKLIDYNDYSKEGLLGLLNESAEVRTIVIHLISLKYHQDPDYTEILLTQLIKEKALYTKIEIQDNLAQYGNPQIMCSYLGKIGNNQYKSIPSKVSLKKSYPLPRDIIARSLAHMNIQNFDKFFHSLHTLSYQQLLEGIDALGFVCFYHPQIINNTIYEYILDLINKYQEDDLMTWKLITCLSAFPQSQNILNEFKQTKKHPTILKEVERSLHIICS